MNTLKTSLKRKALQINGEIKDAIETFIQPFKEVPSANNTGQETAERINAHDLFSFYTADIIKEDIIFSR